MRISDWSSDVCSSDLDPATDRAGLTPAKGHRHRFRHCKEGSRPFPPTQRRRCLRSSSENPAAKPDDPRRGSMPVNPTATNEITAFDWVRSEEHTSELQSLMRISYAVFCLKNTKNNSHPHNKYYRLTSDTQRS